MGRPLPSNRSVALKVQMIGSLRKIELLTKADKKHFCIFYEQNMRGNSVARILASHNESWWVTELMNNTHEPLEPLSFPETVSTFNFIEFGKHNYTLNHTGMMFQDPFNFEKILLQRKNFKDLYWFTWTHPHFHKNIFPKCEFIYLYSSQQNSERKYSARKPLNNDFAFNIDVSLLFSYDREDFYNEYSKIVKKFDFSPKYGSVRAYILSVLDRDAYYKKHMS